MRELPAGERPQKRRREAGYFEAEEIPRLFAELEDSGAYRVLVEVALKTGMRQGELLASLVPTADLTAEQVHNGILYYAIGLQSDDIGDLTPRLDDHALRGKAINVLAGKVLASPPLSWSHFESLSEVREWLRLVPGALVDLDIAFAEERATEVWSYIDAADAEREPGLSEFISDPEADPFSRKMALWMRTSHHSTSVAQREQLAEIRRRKSDLETRLQRLDRYNQRTLPNLAIRIAISLMLAAGLIRGVAIPMLVPDVSKLVAAVIPLVIYAFGFFAFLWVFLRAGRRRLEP